MRQLRSHDVYRVVLRHVAKTDAALELGKNILVLCSLFFRSFIESLQTSKNLGFKTGFEN